MNYVQPTVELYMEKDPLLKLERCIRVAYKSEDKIKDGSAAKLIKAILSHHHTSTLEHYRIQFLCSGYIGDEVRSYQDARGKAFIQVLDAGDDEYDTTLVGNLRAFVDLVNSEDCDHDTRGIFQAALHGILPELFDDPLESYFHSKDADLEAVKFDGEAEDYLTFHVVTDIGVLKEITRHRTLSPTVESTRFCNYGLSGIHVCLPQPYLWGPEANGNLDTWVDELAFYWSENDQKYINADGLITNDGFHEIARLAKVQATWELAMKNAETAYAQMLALGERPQSARSVLPHSTKTEMYLTATISDWEHFLELRTAPDAQPQIQLIAEQIKTLMENTKE